MIATKTKTIPENSESYSALKQKLSHVAEKPIFSSEIMNWRGFGISKHRLPPGSSPERVAAGHYFVVQLNNSVKMDVESKGERYRGRFFKGDVTYAPPGFLCRASWDQEREVLIISIDSSFVAARAGKDMPTESLNFVPQMRVRDPLIEGIAQALGTEVSKEYAKYSNDAQALASINADYANSLAEVLASHIIKDYTTPEHFDNLKTGKLAPVKLRRATDFINGNIETGITLSDIAEVVEMSPFHFARMFKQTTGFTPLQYVMDQKIEYSKSLLRNIELPLADIAFKLGFASQSHFTMHFRRLTGTTPKHFRDDLRMLV